MAFEGLTEKISATFKKLRGKGRLKEADVKEAMREIRMALLEADVSYKVVKDFTKSVTERCIGADVLESLTPAQMIVKIVNEELCKLMGSDTKHININPNGPTVVMLVGLQGAGKTTNGSKLAGLMKRQGKNPLLVCVLKGAVNTLAAFSQAMSIPVQMDFMSLSSYGSGTESSGKITVRQDLSTDVRGRHVLIVEDIIDSGITLAWLVDELKRRGAASVEIFALLEKPARRKVNVDVKYKGREIPDEFVVGFGLDYDEYYRNLDSIAVLKPSVYEGGQA